MRMTLSGTYEFIPNTDSAFAAAWAGTHVLTDFTIDYDAADLAEIMAAMGAGDVIIDHKPMDDLLIGDPVDEAPVDLSGLKYPDEVHPCTKPGCTDFVSYDDEPYCFNHSPDSGSSRPGYSYKKAVLGLPDNVVL